MSAHSEENHKPASPRAVFVMAALIVVAGCVAYSNSLKVPLLFDDEWAIEDNAAIRDLGNIAQLLAPAKEATTAGRPVLNVTFALNYAWGKKAVPGYHVINGLIHVLAGLALFGLVRRTLRLSNFRARYGDAATWLGGAVAIGWLLHPLNTEAVTYISQRAESLMGLCYLLTVYGFVRAAAATSSHQRLWYALSVVACWLGMATKEVMATAPLVVFLYDCAVVGGAWRSKLAGRRWYYASLAGSWLLLGLLMANSRVDARGVGLDHGVGAWAYLCTEAKVLVGYAKLAVWPHPLVFDYGPELIVRNGLRPVLPYAVAVVAALVAVIAAWRKSPPVGFCGLAFFILLAPTSSFVPIVPQPMAESRMYLALVPLVALAVLSLYRWCGPRLALLAVLLAAAMGGLTFQRNHDYGSETGIWRDTLAKSPVNSRAHNNLGLVLSNLPGNSAEAMAQFEQALRLNPNYADAHHNLGSELGKIGRAEEAIAHLEAALRLRPTFYQAHNALGNELARIPGRLPEAIAHLETVLRLKPEFASAHYNLANVLAGMPGRQADALAQYEEALRLNPDLVEAHSNLGNLLFQMPDRRLEAIAHFESALRLRQDPFLYFNLGNVYAAIPGRLPDAIRHYEEMLRLKPDFAQGHNNLAVAYAKSGRKADAIRELETALKLDPNHAEARANLTKLAGTPQP